MENFNYETDVTIIGAGPAGLTAAIYCCRSNISVIILDKKSPGGKVATTALVENYPGYKEISGPDLSFRMFEQANELGSKFLFNEVVDIKTDSSNYKYIELKDKKIIKTKTVIIATGMVNRKIGCPGEENFFHKGISYCAICDGPLYKNKPIAVIGSGRSAIDESIFLSDIGSEIFLISNKSEFKADKMLVEKINRIPNLKIFMQTDTISFNGSNNLESITVQNQITKKYETISVSGVFIFIGFLPICPTVNNNTILSKTSNFIEVDDKMQTSFPGIFAAGDIINKKIRQISTAIGDGTIAALSAVEYINNKDW